MPKIEFEYLWRVVLVLAVLLGYGLRDKASAAINNLDPADREMYQITLDNQLAAHGCK